MAGRGPRKPEKKKDLCEGCQRLTEEQTVKGSQAEGTAWAEAQRRGKQSLVFARALGEAGRVHWAGPLRSHASQAASNSVCR